MTKDKKVKFKTGDSRYCQCCGKESHELFEVTNNAQKHNQLQCCEQCSKDYNKK